MNNSGGAATTNLASSSSMNFAGMTSIHASILSCQVGDVNGQCEWIVDTGATYHMTPNLSYLHSTKTFKTPILITLPDGSIKIVKTVGNVRLNHLLEFNEVLYVPAFKYNLLSVGKLVNTHKLTANFFPTHCVFQNPSTKLIGQLAKGQMGYTSIEVLIPR